MIVLCWNCRGSGRAAVVRHLKVLVQNHKPLIIFLSETISYDVRKLSTLASSLGFMNCECVPSTRKLGGLLICWKANLHLQIVVSNEFLVNTLIQANHLCLDWQLTFVYGPSKPYLKHLFWDHLKLLEKLFWGRGS